MKITLGRNDIDEVIKKYYSEVEGIDVIVTVKNVSDTPNEENYMLTIMHSINIAGMSFTAEEEITSLKLDEILNYFISDDYNIIGFDLNTSDSRSPIGETYKDTKLNIQIESTKQKNRKLNK